MDGNCWSEPIKLMSYLPNDNFQYSYPYFNLLFLEYTDIHFWCHPIRCCIIFASAFKFRLSLVMTKLFHAIWEQQRRRSGICSLISIFIICSLDSIIPIDVFTENLETLATLLSLNRLVCVLPGCKNSRRQIFSWWYTVLLFLYFSGV